MLNGLSICSGIGGVELALESWVKPIAYCENDPYAQCVLLSRMQEGKLPTAPIWDDLNTLNRGVFPSGLPIDIIYGGTPCQNISVTGDGTGLDGESSKLFFELVRLVSELRPKFIFMENSPAITVRGLDRVLLEFSALGYDCRWTIISAGELGAPHLRERFFLLAHSNSNSGGHSGEKIQPRNEKMGSKSSAYVKHYGIPLDSDSARIRWGKGWSESDATRNAFLGGHGCSLSTSDATSEGLERWVDALPAWQAFALGSGSGSGSASWPSWVPQPAICRTDAGFPYRVDKLRGVGNAVPPQQYREAFQRLMGLK